LSLAMGGACCGGTAVRRQAPSPGGPTPEASATTAPGPSPTNEAGASAADAAAPGSVSDPDLPNQDRDSSGKKLSMKSEAALQELVQLEGKLSTIEERVDELAAQLKAGELTDALGQVKTELAMLESEAHKLESGGVDNVYTSDLTTGKESAKETKRMQLQRLEALFAKFDEVFRTIAQQSEALVPPQEEGSPDVAEAETKEDPVEEGVA